MDIKNSYYHITETKSIQAIIDSGGLICQTGENCKTDNDTNKAVYFVEGIEGIYKLTSRFLKKTDYENTPQNKIEEESVRVDKGKDSNLMDKTAMEFSKVDGKFDKFAESLKSKTFFQLDIEKGRDFKDYSDIDERFTKSNMYTYKDVLLDKMNIVEVDGKSNSYEFLKYIYSNFKNELWDKSMDFGKGDGKYYLELLDRFMERELNKEKSGKNVEFQSMDKEKSLMHESINLGSNELTDRDLLNVTTALSKQIPNGKDRTNKVSKKMEELL